MILAIGAGQLHHKKSQTTIQRQTRYLNVGLLGLCTMLHRQGKLPIRMFQGGTMTPEELLQQIAQEGITIDRDCSHILLSVPSCYSITWCQRFCRLLRKMTLAPIVIGGRWVVDGQVPWIQNLLPEATVILEGFGERPLAALFGIPEKQIPDGANYCFSQLEYPLLYRYEEYCPSIEISRGCGCGCQFCLDGENPQLPNQEIPVIQQQLTQLDRWYGTYPVYLEAPHFSFSISWTEALCRAMGERDRVVPWRCTTRVETVPTDRLPMLRQAGLRIFDVGLESASPTQLLRMGKTRNPKQYLQRAGQLLQACHREGILVKLNILLYAGETMQTVEETRRWLRAHRHLIAGVSVGSIIYYRGMGCLASLLRQGAKVQDTSQLDRVGYLNLDPSDVLSYAHAQQLAQEISREMMDGQAYYALKSHGYFRRGYTYEQFCADAARSPTDQLPFRKNI